MADLIFYTHPMSRGQTIRWMLEEVGEPYDTEILDYASTMKQEPYALVTDRYQLDMFKLLPFFTDAEIEKALRQWAKTTGHREKMAGAEIGFRNAGVTR